jgi:hypothetical protein
MSAKSDLQLADEARPVDEVCACCGIAAVDDIKLKKCDGGCDLVKYCSDGCQENHREQHSEDCRKRKTDLHDKELFTQTDRSHEGECPICCLPLSLEPSKSIFMSCCCKKICDGCNLANKIREIKAGLEHRCPFCREPAPDTDEQHDSLIINRIKKNDPVAMTQMGKKHLMIREDHGKSFEYFTKAAELSDAAAHGCLGLMYRNGDSVVEKDEEKAVYHLEQAAIGGNPTARAFLATHEMENGRFERAARHLIISANLGCDVSLRWVKDLFVQGIVSKEEYADALRGYQAAMDATKSAEREAAEAFSKVRDAAPDVEKNAFERLLASFHFSQLVALLSSS